MPSPSKSPSSAKKATNLSLNKSLLNEARGLGINLSQAAEAGVAKAIADKRAALWLEESYEAIASSNDYVAQQGLPLAKYRMF